VGFLGTPPATVEPSIATRRAFRPRVWTRKLPRMTRVAKDGRVLLVAGLVLCGTAVIAGVIPAWVPQM